MSTRKTMTQRRAAFFETIKEFRAQADYAGFARGQRVASPGTHDTGERRLREERAGNRVDELHQQLISQFNAAVRAAAQGARRG
jgi:hypothetical protein